MLRTGSLTREDLDVIGLVDDVVLRSCSSTNFTLEAEQDAPDSESIITLRQRHERAVKRVMQKRLSVIAGFTWTCCCTGIGQAKNFRLGSSQVENSGAGRDQRNRGQQSHRATNSNSAVKHVTTAGWAEKNTGASSSGPADKKPDASSAVSLR
ncbi:hypothetical protein Tco_1094520 [Tanacetum coccineum]|uniref:Uncharacterized protein n=1 Tax=Tanacetum coccineum TaxID=301880 RepID=A0ABQ5IFW6_9ASTR